MAAAIGICVEILLFALIALTALAFGGVYVWTQQLALAFCAAMTALTVVRQLVLRQPLLRSSWSFLPIGAFVLLFLFQLIPLPERAQKFLSPQITTLREQLLGAPFVLSNHGLSSYPAAARESIRVIAIAITCFLIAVHLYRESYRIRRFLIFLTIFGGLVAALALAQTLTGAKEIYWTVPTPRAIANSGPFVHYSHYSQFMNLCVGGALGLLLLIAHENSGDSGNAVPMWRRLRAPHMRWFWIASVAIVLGAVTIALSLSRAGTLAFIASLMSVAVAMGCNRRTRDKATLVGAIGLVFLAALLYLGLDKVFNRITTVADAENFEIRSGILRDSVRASTQFPLFGTGLGTFRYVFPMYDRSVNTLATTHAENEYAEVTFEMGYIGLSIVFAFCAFVVAAYVKCIRHTEPSIRIIAFGLGFGLSAVAIQSFFDFGQHLPANACLSSVFCGLLIRLRCFRRNEQREKRVSAIFSWPIGMAGLAACGIAFAWLLRDANQSRAAEAAFLPALRLERLLAEEKWQATDDQLATLISDAQVAAKLDPLNIDYRYSWDSYRAELLNHSVDPDTGKLKLSPAQLDEARNIADDLAAARVICPTFGPIYALQGYLELLALHKPNAAETLRLGAFLAPTNRDVVFYDAEQDATNGKLEQSYEKFVRYVELGGAIDDVYDVYLNEVKQPQYALKLASGDLARLRLLLDALGKTQGNESMIADAQSQIDRLAAEQLQRPDAPAQAFAERAQTAEHENDFAAAIAYYSRAIEKDNGRVDWRLARARLFAKTGENSKATQDARMCLQLRPQMSAARELLETVVVQSRRTTATK